MTASAASPDDLSLLHNRTFAELAVGDAASTERVLTRDDVHAFAALAGVTQSPAQPGAARSIWGGALISSLIDSRLPGPGTVHLEQALTFHAPLQVGDRLKITVQVQSMEASTGQVVLACRCVNQNGATVIDGTARVMAPTERIELPRAGLPEIHRDSNGNDGLGRLLAHVAPLAAIPVAVVHPCDAPSLKGALDARNVGLIEPVLVGPKARIDAVAQQEGLDLSGVVIEDAAHSHAAASPMQRSIWHRT